MEKTCVFCSSTGKKSKEHIWPVWMHEYLPLLGDGNHISEINTFKWKEHIGSKKLSRQGHLTTKKLRVVCQACNSGWMSELESQIKPILIKILARENFELGEKEQEILARWITMKSMIGEHAEKGTHMTPSGDRRLFMLEKKIPDYFAIYIGGHSVGADTAWLRISQTIALSPEGPSPPLGSLKRNMQSIAFICGSLFVYVFAVRENGIKPTEFLRLNKLKRVLPKQSDLIKWPPTDMLTKTDMSQIAWALDDIKKSDMVWYAGDLP